MNDLHAMTEGDVDTVARNIARIKAIADEMAGEGVSQAFDIYKLARDTLEILAFDRISRDALTKLGAGDEQLQGHKVTKQVLEFIKNSQKINAIKEFRMETGLGLKEAKDWVEAYMTHHSLQTW